MKKFNSFANHMRHAASSKLVLASAFVVLSGGVVAFNALSRPSAVWADLPRDCNDNSIIYCGATTKDEFVQDYNENKTGDLPAIYEAFGLSQGELGQFQQSAKMGTIYKDGRVVVDGQVVAHDAKSIGRHNKPGATPMNIAGKTYYLRSNSTAFQSDSIQGHVLMNGDKVEFVALTACGNPVTVTQPEYSCNMLHREKITDDTYEFTSEVTAKNGATLTKVVYDFGDGKTVEKTNPAEVVRHTYSKPGSYTAKVTAYFEYHGQTKTHTQQDCTKQIEVPQPPKPVYECTGLTANKITRTKYEFTATSKVGGGASLKNADFDFGDSQTAEDIVPTADNEVAIEHEYAKQGDYTITATLNFNVADGVQSHKCVVKITVDNQPPKECKPGIPEGDERCEEKPEVPAELPSTGPLEVVGSALGLGGITAAGSYYLRTRRDLLGTIFKR